VIRERKADSSRPFVYRAQRGWADLNVRPNENRS
jgi:hypothetical protein